MADGSRRFPPPWQDLVYRASHLAGHDARRRERQRFPVLLGRNSGIIAAVEWLGLRRAQ
jgi:hypothetical protein